eukprot:364604-Chlamydomonas_euryale.AAC.13
MLLRSKTRRVSTERSCVSMPGLSHGLRSDRLGSSSTSLGRSRLQRLVFFCRCSGWNAKRRRRTRAPSAGSPCTLPSG